MRLTFLSTILLGSFVAGQISTAQALPVSPIAVPPNRIKEVFGVEPTPPVVNEGFVEDELGIPVEAARIFIDGEEVSASDESGNFRLPNDLRKGTGYTLTVRKSGFVFDLSSLPFQVGDTPTFAGRETLEIPDSCIEAPQAEVLVSGGKLAALLRRETLALVSKIPRRSKLRLLSGEVISASELPSRVEEQFATFSFYSTNTPEVDFQCDSESACITFDARETKVFLSLEIDNLSHERLLVNRVLRQRGKISAAKARKVTQSVVSNRAKVKRGLSGLGDFMLRCR